ncbi:MAG: PAS domain S-box protein [Desulfobacteraceae bacterium]|nr:PAS domain S-box protein [Desulfobacteraceae bacterium]
MDDLIATLVENADDLAAITESSGKLLYLNNAARKRLGVGQDTDVTQLHIQRILPKDNHWEAERKIDSPGADTGGFQEDPPAGKLKENGHPLFCKVLALRGPGGGIAGFSYYSPALTGTQEQRQEPQPARESLQAWIRGSNAIVAAADEEAVVQSALQAAAGITGCRFSAFCEFSTGSDDGLRIKQHYASASDTFSQNDIHQILAPLRCSALQNLMEYQQAVRLSEASVPGLTQTPAADPSPLHDMICARLFNEQNETRGLLLVWDPGEIGETEEALLVQLASFTSLALQRFRARRISDHMTVEMSQVFSALAEPVIVYDTAGTPIMANPAAIQMMGFDPEGLSWKTFIQKKGLRYSNSRPVPFEQLPCYRALSGSPVRSERYLRTDVRGTDRIYEFNAVPLLRNGEIVGAVTVARDETERTALLNQLETERTALQAIINNAPEAIIVADEECRIVMTNPAAKELYQLSHADLPEETASALGDASAAYDPVDLPLARSVFQGEMIVDHELTVYTHKNECRHILVNTAPIRNPNGEITGAVGLFHDITQRKKERLELQRARTDLEKRVAEQTAELRHTVETLQNEIEERKHAEVKLQDSQEKLRQLSHRMLHTLESDRQKIAKELHDSLGASLAAIKFSLEEKLANMPPTPPDKTMSIENIVSYLTGAIKETKRISANLRPTILDDLGLLATITWFCREFNAFYHQIRIEQEIEIEEPEVAEPLKIVIFRILQEAMNNAAKHGQPDTIRLSLEKTGDRIELIVSDNGAGFDPETRFDALDSMSGHGIQGMRERANVCGGEFEIDSRPGAGTRVRVSFPQQAASAC